MKALILSVRPEHAIKIITGNKTLELRKRVPKDFKGWVYVYVTKAIKDYKKSYYYQPKGKEEIFRLHGIIPARFWFDEYEVVVRPTFTETYYQKVIKPVLKKSCLTYEELNKYSNGKDLYAWHIKNLEIFDKPMQLSEFIKDFPYASRDAILSEIKNQKLRIKKAPQSYIYAWVKEEGK